MTEYDENSSPSGANEQIAVPHPIDSFVFGDPTPGHMKRNLVQSMLETPTTIEFLANGQTVETGHMTEVGVERVWELPDLGFDELGESQVVIDPTSAVAPEVTP